MSDEKKGIDKKDRISGICKINYVFKKDIVTKKGAALSIVHWLTNKGKVVTFSTSRIFDLASQFVVGDHVFIEGGWKMSRFMDKTGGYQNQLEIFPDYISIVTFEELEEIKTMFKNNNDALDNGEFKEKEAKLRSQIEAAKDIKAMMPEDDDFIPF